MTPSTGRKRFGDLPRSYRELVVYHPPRPIHDRIELEAATEIIDAMAGHELTADQADYLDLMSDLVEKYEAEHEPVDVSHVGPVEALRELMDRHDMTASELGRLLGDRSLGSRILSGERELSKAHVRTLAERFNVSPELFL